MMTPTQPPKSRSIAIALWVNAAVLGLILVTLLNRSNVPSILPAAMGQNQPPIAGGAGVFVMPAQTAQQMWGAYLLDVDNQTLCVYQFYPGEKKLRLSAARSYKYDRKLENFNADPSPKEIKAMVERAAAGLQDGPAPADNKDKDKN